MNFIGLSGKISGVLKKGVYNVVANLEVAPNDTLIIEPGVELRFMKYINFTVKGTIFALGTIADTIRFTRFDDTTAWGGVRLDGQTSNSIISYAVIEHAERTGINANNSNLRLENIVVRYNANISEDIDGEGISLFMSKPIIRNSVITKNNLGKKKNMNNGGGIYFSGGSNAIIENSIISYNSADYGGGAELFDSRPIFRNVLIYGNTAKNGAGIHLGQFAYTLENVIVANNTAEAGAGICGGGNNNKVYNSIIAFNHGGGVEGSVVHNCCVYGDDFYNFRNCGEWYGVNVKTNKNGDSCDVYDNIVLDPQFVDYLNGDFRLKNTSPCIDAGTNEVVNMLTDFFGNKRIWDGNDDRDTIIDIGAVEYSSEPVFMLKAIEENGFEDGIGDWTINNNSGNCKWEIEVNPEKAYKGNGYLKIKGDAQQCNSYLISSEVLLPPDSSSYLIVFAKNEKETNPVSEEMFLSGETGKASIKILVSEQGTDIENFNYLENVETPICESWQKYIFDLSKFSGKDINIAIESNIENTNLNLDEISVKTSGIVSNIEDEIINNSISIYPNPANDFITIDADNIFDYKIQLLDIFGNILFSQINKDDHSKRTIDISNLSSGVYYIRISSGKDVVVKQFFVVR